MPADSFYFIFFFISSAWPSRSQNSDLNVTSPMNRMVVETEKKLYFFDSGHLGVLLLETKKKHKNHMSFCDAIKNVNISDTNKE